ncbi:BatD family protein [Aliikangiella maris]|uniref:BatD family protein n=2 Tax=Aliikangiella maris TaxID=3162458 RepID=A0ABV3MJN7_9GAMM
MHQLKLIFFILFINTLLIANSEANEAVATLDRTDIAAGETFVLDIRIDYETDEQPDLSLIPQDITILSNSQYQNIQIVNNARSVVKGWKLKLKTLKPGKLTIPSITVGNQATQPIELNIRDASDELTLGGQKKTIFLEAEIDQYEPYVQQQIIYTVSLYRAVNTHYASLSDPTANNSIVEKLGDDSQFEKVINNRRYSVVKRQYAIFPQQSGELTISGVNFNADVNDNSRRNYGTFFNTTRPVSISTKPIKVNVRPQPTSAPNPWIPAQDVILSDKWTPNTNSLTVGEPITWTLLLSVQGLSESQLPEIAVPKVDGLQWYHDTPQKDRQINGKGIVGQRVEKIAVIPATPGSITIPEISIQWWDIKTDSLKTATIKSRTFEVLPAENSATNTPNLNLPLPVESIPHPIQPASDEQLTLWQNIATGFFTLWIITLLAYFNKRSTTPAKLVNAEEQQNQLRESLNSKQQYQKLCGSLKSGNAQAIEKDLLRWLNTCGFDQLQSLGAVIKQVKVDTIRDKLAALQAQRYSATSQESVAPLTEKELEQLISDLSPQREIAASSNIPPLYPR